MKAIQFLAALVLIVNSFTLIIVSKECSKLIVQKAEISVQLEVCKGKKDLYEERFNGCHELLVSHECGHSAGPESEEHIEGELKEVIGKALSLRPYNM